MPYQWSKLSHIEPKFNIFFDHNLEYEATESAIAKIKSGKNGSQILQALKENMNHENQLDILVDIHSLTETGGELTASQEKKYHIDRSDPAYREKVLHLGSNGFGVRPVIYYNPLRYIEIDRHNRSWQTDNEHKAFVSLAHEMVHALHLINGTTKAEGKDKVHDLESSQMEEEERAVGIGYYSNNNLSENGVRRDHRLRLRASYYTQN